MRFAAVYGARDSDEVRALLPDNYEVYGHRFPGGDPRLIVVLICGVDESVWTLDEYVKPRLSQELMHCEERIPTEGAK